MHSSSWSTQETRVEYYAGLVLSVDPANRLLSIEEASLDAEVRTLSIPADAELYKQGHTIELGAIRVGEALSIEYENSDTGPVARNVKVITKRRNVGGAVDAVEEIGRIQ